MIDPGTLLIVAPVVDLHPARDLAVMKLPRVDVAAHVLVGDAKSWVAGIKTPAEPSPASAEFGANNGSVLVDFGPEPLFVGRLSFGRRPFGCRDGIEAGLAPAAETIPATRAPREMFGRRWLVPPALGASLGFLYARSIHGLILRGSRPRTSQSVAGATHTVAQLDGCMS